MFQVNMLFIILAYFKMMITLLMPFFPGGDVDSPFGLPKEEFLSEE